MAQPRHELRGVVLESVSGKPVRGANLYVNQTGAGTTTDSLGQFALQLRAGTFSLDITAVGYAMGRENITLSGDRAVTFRIASRVFELDEVEIRAREPGGNFQDVRMSQILLSMPQLKKMPVVLGEPDILRALTLQAGVSTAGEGAGGFNVRGGRADQNLVLLDGAPLFNTSHLLGFFTNVSSDAVQDVTLFKGGFPAQYGGRVSSLLLMNTRAGNREGWRVSGGVSPISTRLLVDGPISRKLTLLAGGRIAYPTYIMRLFPTNSVQQSRAFFYDGNIKLQYSPNERNAVSLSAYRSQDSFQFPGDTLYGWQSNVASLKWSSLIRPNLQLNVNALYSGFAYHIDGLDEGLTFRLNSYIRHREVKADLFYTLARKHRIQVGANGILYQVQKGDLQPIGSESNVNPQRLEPENAREGGLYLQTEWLVSPALTVQAGLRYSLYSQVGPQTVYKYEPSVPRSPETITDSVQYKANQPVQPYGGWEPRLGIRLQLGAASSLKVNYSRMRQYIHLISNTTAITPIDFWKVSDRYVPNQIADQFAVGLFQNLRDNAIEMSLEAYYRSLNNLVEYRNGATLLLNRTLETDLLPAKGRAYGIEFSISNSRGRLTGQFNYAYARSLVAVQTTFSELQVNRGAYYPSTIDRPHILNLQTRWALPYNWSFSANFVYSTGIPATYPDGQYLFNEEPVLNYSRRNADRVPDYHRLDVSFSKDTRRNNRQTRYSIWNLGIYNLYARKNPYSIYFTRNYGQTRSYRLAVFGTLIPSVTYNFYF
ncbi:TonB-dependent receptor [Nibrella saemangeumensis]|uniref:TonB-dependent receptor n=2 Tax=Nibrella saemangeumensis TaxID=1084526 RepID=A0ABP8N0M3_9BACT